MALQNLLRFGKGGSHGCGYKAVLGHNVLDFHIEVSEETHIAVGDDADKLFVFIANRHATDFVSAHQLVCVCGGMILGEVERVHNNAVFGTFYLVDLLRLLFNGHIFVDYTDTALAGNGDCHFRLGNGVHCCGHNRCVEHDSLCKNGFCVNIFREHIRLCRNKKHVVECKPFVSKLFVCVWINHFNSLLSI